MKKLMENKYNTWRYKYLNNRVDYSHPNSRTRVYKYRKSCQLPFLYMYIECPERHWHSLLVQKMLEEHLRDCNYILRIKDSCIWKTIWIIINIPLKALKFKIDIQATIIVNCVCYLSGIHLSHFSPSKLDLHLHVPSVWSQDCPRDPIWLQPQAICVYYDNIFKSMKHVYIIKLMRFKF